MNLKPTMEILTVGYLAINDYRLCAPCALRILKFALIINVRTLSALRNQQKNLSWKHNHHYTKPKNIIKNLKILTKLECVMKSKTKNIQKSLKMP